MCPHMCKLESVLCTRMYTATFATIQKARACNTWVRELYMCLHVLNLGEQEHAWITRDKHQGDGRLWIWW